VSPRIVRAEVDGTGGVTQVTGPQLRQRFGLFDTWASFTYISSNAKKKSSDDGAGGGEGAGAGATTTTPGATTAPTSGGATTPPALDPSTGAAAAARVAPVTERLTGTIRPAKRGTRLAVQRRIGRAWRTVGTTRVGRGGTYDAAVAAPGTYRVALGDVAGPALDIR
jgi:stage II sporulation protein D